MNGMKQINVAMIPEILAKIVKELELIDEWLDLRIGSEKDDAIDKQEEWLNIYELCNMLPGRPRVPTVRGWMAGCTLKKSHTTCQEGHLFSEKKR